MGTLRLVRDLERDAVLIQAMHQARYALVITNGGMLSVEGGEPFRVSFDSQIEALTGAMRLLGVDTDKLPAPPSPAND